MSALADEIEAADTTMTSTAFADFLYERAPDIIATLRDQEQQIAARRRAGLCQQ